MALDALKDGMVKLSAFGASNPVATAVGAAGAGALLGVGTAALVGKIKSRKSKRRKTRNSRKRTRSSKRGKKRRYKYARTAGKRKDTSHKRIRMTKNGQPYIITSNGRAKFISKSSARRSRKLKGGRY